MNTFHANDRRDWRAWLKANHASETEIWLVFFKAQTGQPNIPYDDAVEEALCFGWIDSLIKKIDEEKYARKFTLRRPGSKWSALNKSRVEKMIREGRMTEAGLAKIDYTGSEDGYGRTPQRKADELVVPPYFQEPLSGNPQALENFNRLAPSHRRRYIQWISAAKTEATREKRLAEAIELLAENEKLGMR